MVDRVLLSAFLQTAGQCWAALTTKEFMSSHLPTYTCGPHVNVAAFINNVSLVWMFDRDTLEAHISLRLAVTSVSPWTRAGQYIKEHETSCPTCVCPRRLVGSTVAVGGK